MASLTDEEDDILSGPSLFNVDDLLRGSTEFNTEQTSHPTLLNGGGAGIWAFDGAKSTFDNYNVLRSPLGQSSVIGESAEWHGNEHVWSFDSNISPIGAELNNGSASTPMSPISDTISQEGLNMYAEALSRFMNANRSENSVEPIYDPFQLNGSFDLGSFHSHVDDAIDSQSCGTDDRPTFADVTRKASLAAGTNSADISKEGSVYESQESLSSTGKGRSSSTSRVQTKTFRIAHARHAAASQMPLPIPPDSKYGLDEFPPMESDEKENQPIESEKWFDPRRMFSTSSRTRSESEPTRPSAPESRAPLLNNKSRLLNGGKNSRRGQTEYINNLHSNAPNRSKQTNAERDAGAKSSTSNGVRRGQMNGHTNGSIPNSTTATSNSNKRKNEPMENSEDLEENQPPTAKRLSVRPGLELTKYAAVQLVNFIIWALMLLLTVSAHLLLWVAQHVCAVVTRSFSYLAVKVGFSTHDEDDGLPTRLMDFHLPLGLENNIKLPDTSEEAMSRLLICHEKDAYSILGLRSDVSNDDIKRYYKRQALLVHPDKTRLKGAEESFKILAQAFELIGDPNSREIYDRKIRGERLSGDIQRGFEELLTNLQEKLDEQRRWLYCTNCNDNHRRYKTDKKFDSARKCSLCSTHHPCKEGDMWAETTFLGYKWHIYACMDNSIYEITDWASCQNNLVDKLRPNSHEIQFRMATGKEPAHPNNRSNLPPDYEAFLRNLLTKNEPPTNSPPDPKPPNHTAPRKNKRRGRGKR